MDTETDMSETAEENELPEMTETPEVQDTPEVQEQEVPETEEEDIDLDFWDKDQEQPQEEKQEEQTGDGLPEGFDLTECPAIPEDMHGGLGAIARKHGIAGAAASAMLKEALSLADQRAAAQNKAEMAALKRELGKDFRAEIDATAGFMARMAKKAGLSKEDCSILMSPKGYRLMSAIRKAAGESETIRGGGQTAPKMSIEEQMDAIYNNETDYNALTNPMDPRHREVNDRMNKLVHALEESKRRR